VVDLPSAEESSEERSRRHARTEEEGEDFEDPKKSGD
jgi:hypothetical protein